MNGRDVQWTEHDIPDQRGRNVVITGANSGLGLRAATVLAARGARVLLCCRSPERGKQALAIVDSAQAELIPLDLADLSSVRTAAETVRERTGDRLDVLINNAGIGGGTPLRYTPDGFESIIGTNHFGHAVLTWLLMPALRNGSAARVVNVSSIAHRGKGFDLADLNFENRQYRSFHAYSQSKVANLLFTMELDRRLRASGSPVSSLAAHPGSTNTELAANGARSQGSDWLARAFVHFNKLITQSTAAGTLPVLYAAAGVKAKGGDYYGPAGFQEVFGGVGPARLSTQARDKATATALWELTAEFTGVTPDPG